MAKIYKLDCREKPVGGGLEDFPPRAALDMNGKSEVLLLIHGYNNDEEDAETSYSKFLKNIALSRLGRRFGMNVFQVYWPGDWKVFSALSYPFMVKRAPLVAEKLENLIRGMSGPGGTPMQIRIVAHSLGCRVTLELIHLINTVPQTGNHRVASFCLMAAAVPEKMVDVNGRLHDAARLNNVRSKVLHSRSDITLHWAFPVGQTAAGSGEYFFPTAVGRSGQPEIWSSSSVNIDGYDHSDYWKGQNTVAPVLDSLSVSHTRKIRQRVVAPDAGIARRAIRSHAVPEREVAGRVVVA